MKKTNGKDKSYEIFLEGVVQGVGMRPFIYRLAREMGIRGWVNNTGEGVRICAEGGDIDDFVRRIREEKPSLAMITCLDVRHVEDCAGYRNFEILTSHEAEVSRVLISPDVAVCPECLDEVYDQGSRRYGYAFTNCTNCGPRYTIVKERPYDRNRTTMAGFVLCAACAEEYHSAGDRRFHAQPVACPVCGPRLEFIGTAEQCHGAIEGYEPSEGLREGVTGKAALDKARQLLGRGGILALKGLGGYHLACDAGNNDAVRALRCRKERGAKPFAVMAKNKGLVKRVALLSDLEEEWLTSAAAPIVVLQRRRFSSVAAMWGEGVEEADAVLSEEVSPGLDTLGVMLPYTPLHDLLMEGMFEFLVLTSANLSGQPLIYQDDEAMEKLKELVDGFLRHDREIFHPCDDSVVRRIGRDMTFYRRARGYVPLPLRVPMAPAVLEERFQGDDQFRSEDPRTRVLAVGADMKNAFCFLEGDRAFMSPYLGEMSDKMSFDRFRQEILSWQALLHMEADIIVHDAHPDYVTARWAKNRVERQSQGEVQLPCQSRCEVYHHHAHLVSVMGEHNLTRPTLGLIADGTGYGTDGRIWGCEVLFGDARSFERLAHLQYLPLPGGEGGIKYPLRTAYAYFVMLQPEEGWEDFSVWERLTLAEREMLRAQVTAGIQVGLTSSAGRLFDVMAALLGICHEVTYEAQGAMEMENLAWRWEWERRRKLGYKWEDNGSCPGYDIAQRTDLYRLIWKKQVLGIGDGDNLWEKKGQEAFRKEECLEDGRGAAERWRREPDVLEVGAFFAALWRDLKRNQNSDVHRISELAWKCHGSLAWGLGNYLEQMGAEEKRVVLAGGVFQNKLLTEMLEAYLVSKGWTVYRGKQLPPGDGGVSFGQALVGRGYSRRCPKA